MRSLKVLVGFVLLLFLSGCAFIDQNVSLKYTPSSQDVAAAVGDRLILLSGPEMSQRLKQKGTSYIIGTVKNTLGMHTADTITDDNVGEWIVEALATELKMKGIVVRRIEKFPEMFDNGVNVRVTRVWVDQDPGFWTLGALSDVSFILEMYSSGVMIKKIAVEGKGDSRGIVATAGQREESLTKALRAALEKAVPEILSTLK